MPRGNRGLITMRVHGASMIPLVKPGWRVLIDRAVPIGALCPGDIIALRDARNGQRVLHRFLERTPRGRKLETKGDALPWRDKPWPADAYLGRLVAVSPRENQWLRVLPWTNRLILGFGRVRPARLGSMLRFLLTCSGAVYALYNHSERRGIKSIQPAVSHRRWSQFHEQQLGTDLFVYVCQTRSVHALNDTAAKVWRLAREGLAPRAIVERLTGEYPGVDYEVLYSDVASTVCDLENKGLLIISN